MEDTDVNNQPNSSEAGDAGQVEQQDQQVSDTQTQEQTTSANNEEVSQHVPYDRFQEVVNERNQYRAQADAERRTLEAFMSRGQQQAPQKDELDDLDVDPSIKKLMKIREMKLKDEFAQQINALGYNMEKRLISQSKPELRGREDEIDKYCMDYRNRYGHPIAIEAAAEIVAARYKNPSKVAKPTKQAQVTNQQPPRQTSVGITTTGGSAVRKPVNNNQTDDSYLDNMPL